MHHMPPYICFVKYPSIKEITDLYSGMYQSCMVWGGDAIIAEICQSPFPPCADGVNSGGLCSFSVLNADASLITEDQEKVTRDFYNDALF